jgi:hypothetical protein
VSTQRIIIEDCKGPNRECKREAAKGLTYHFAPGAPEGFKNFVMPRHHFVDEADALDYTSKALSEAVIVHNETQRDAAYARKVPVLFALDYTRV